MTVHPALRKPRVEQPLANHDRDSEGLAAEHRDDRIEVQTMKSTGPAALHQVRHGNQHMHADDGAKCPTPDRISNRNPQKSTPAAVRSVIGHLDFAAQCELGFLDNGFRCDLPAVAYVEFHMVGHCQRFDCDAQGNARGFVCADHLDALEYTAQCTAEEMQPTFLGRLFNRVARCATCDRPLLSESDILQTVVMI
jgi:hypothetical protein